MKRRIVVFIILISSLLPVSSFARGGSHRSGGHASGSYVHSSRSYSHSPGSHSRKSNSTTKQQRAPSDHGVAHDSGGKIKRSSAEKKEYMKETGYPHGRPGYVVDHVVPLKRGGADSSSNMQWQTKEAAKAKDKWE